MTVAIVGGGIGGLTTALALQASGTSATVFEQAGSIRELGVGINVLPTAVGVLADLGLADELSAVGVETRELFLGARDGTVLSVEPRGVHAGHPVPQVSVHRGRLQKVLLDAVVDRLGADAVRCGHRLPDVRPDAGGADLTFDTEDGPRVEATEAVIGADGIHSAVRAAQFGDDGPPHWSGSIIWRGATEFPTFLGGASQVIFGGMEAKLVVYPIAPAERGRVLTNWAIVRQIAEDGDQPPARESWSRTATHDAVAETLGHIETDLVDAAALVEATETIYEYPMCDRDPLPRWTVGPVTLLADAAHPMYPVGSNGATQAIIDAACLATQFAASPDAGEAFERYEAIRRPATAEIVIGNRSGGPEGIIDDYEHEHFEPLSRP